MKKLSLVLLAVLAFTFVGCEGWLDIPDPEPEPEPDPAEEALITLEETSTTMNSGDTYQINAECEFPITYTSEDEYVASVSEDGEVTANFVGTTNIMLETEGDSQAFEVTVAPVSELYPEPEIQFGESKEAIIERFGEPNAETEDAIGYGSYSENTTMLMVVFTEDDLVDYYAVILNVEYAEELDTFLGERYLYVNEEDGVKAYINALNENDATMYIGSQLQEEFLMAFYVSAEDEGGDGEEGRAMNSRILKVLKKLVK